ncbi:hypothetical protein FOA52_015413 [Chlamydomonas sp. UWO 241]|nr:hypothetical protein FOA52_015413 [Chlamydomonas sp. UWO 241]
MDDGKGTSQSQSKRAWYLDRKCDLSPRDAGSIQEPAPMRVRPEGTWSITARVRKAGEPVSLFTFTVLWPKSWAAKGYTRFTMGFESLSEAREWHGAVSSSINHLRERHHMKTKGSRQGSLAGRSAESVEGQSPPHTPAPSIANNVVVSAHPLTAIDTPSARFRSPPESVAGGAGPEPSRFASADAQSSIADFDDNFHDAEDGPSSSSDEDDDDRVGGPQRAASRDTKHRWSSVSARAVPYKQTNGVAIYHLDDPDKGGWGGEFMVTASIRGSPSDVLSVLMRGSSNTTILGPATVVESLECVKTDGGKETKQVVRLVLEAPGWTGWACAPRELVVEQMIKRDEGTYVLLFSSVDTVRACSLRCLLGGGPKASPPMSVQRSKMKTRSLYSTPVLGEVRGTYVISPLKGFKLDASPETLITCILKVDLGGACGDRAWVRPFADMLGWTDAFLDRILMSVILVRDVVEHSRFVLKPLSLLATTGAGPRPEDQESSTGRREGVTSRSGGSGDADDEAHLPPGVRSSSSRGKMFSRLSSGTVAAAAVAAQAVAAGKARHGVAPLHGAGAQPARKARRRERASVNRAPQPAYSQMAVESRTGNHCAAVSRRGSSTVSLGPLNEEGVGAGDDPGEAEGSGGGYDGGGSVLDLAAIKAKCTLEAKYWDEIHAPGTDAPFRVRGPTYLKDRKKVPAGLTAFTFGAMDVVTMPHAVTHIARYLPSIRYGSRMSTIADRGQMITIVSAYSPTEAASDEETGDFYLRVAALTDKANDNRDLLIVAGGSQRRAWDSSQLRRPAVRREFNLQLSDRFGLLEAVPPEGADAQAEYDAMAAAIHEVATNHLAPRGSRRRRGWQFTLSQRTLRLMDARQRAHSAWLRSKSAAAKRERNRANRAADAAVQRDRERWIGQQVAEAQDMLRKKNLRQFARACDRLAGRSRSHQIPPAMRDVSGALHSGPDGVLKAMTESFDKLYGGETKLSDETLNQLENDVAAFELTRATEVDEAHGRPPDLAETGSCVRALRSAAALGGDQLDAMLLRESRAPFAIIINLIIPGVPLLGIVGTFITDRHPDILGQPPKRPMEEDHDWEGFDFVLHRFLNGTPASRNLMLKLIPHIADGSWVIKQSVGTTPVITGKALKTTYHVTKQYIEVDIDVSANQVAAYVTGLVRGATKSLVIDMGFVLEGTAPWELPECLLGALRLNYLDIAKAVPLDMSREVPLLPASAVPAGTLHSRTSSLAQAQLAAFNPNEKLDPERFASMSTQPPQSGVHRRAAAAAATAAAATTQRDS